MPSARAPIAADPPADGPHQHASRCLAVVVTVGAVAAVSTGAALFAHLFRESILAVADLLASEGEGPVAAARSLGAVRAFLLVTVGVTAAAWVGRIAHRRYGDRLGLRSIAAAARDEGPDPTLGGTMLRTSATWLATSSLASLGREAPIMETGGMLGNIAGRIVRRPGHRLAVAGIAAAFAVAYHAPVAAVLYVEEHLRVRHDRRTVAHAIAGALIGFAFAQRLLDAQPVFPSAVDPLSRDVLVLALVGILPAYVASRLFLEARDRATTHRATGTNAALRAVALAMVVGAIVGLVPLTAGNGMEAIRTSATSATAGLAFAMLAGKLVATTAAVGSGAPGGVVSPSLAVAGGAALTSFLVVDALGIHLGGSSWDGILVAMAVGVAISVRSPLVASVMVAEMAGDLRLLPLTFLVVALATAGDRVLDHRLRRSGEPVPAMLHDEDA